MAFENHERKQMNGKGLETVPVWKTENYHSNLQQVSVINSLILLIRVFMKVFSSSESCHQNTRLCTSILAFLLQLQSLLYLRRNSS